MLKSDVVRAQPEVRAFDFSEKLQEYGFTTGTRADIEKAREVIGGMVASADADMTRIVEEWRELGQNPYKRSVQTSGEEIKFAMELPLFSNGELTARINRAFTGNDARPNAPVPTASVIARHVCDGIRAMAKEAGYEVCAVDQGQDGSPTRIVLRDPAYAAEAAEHTGAESSLDLSSVSTLLREQAAKKRDESAEAMGFVNNVTTTDVATARAVAKKLIDGGVATIKARIKALHENGLSAFSEAPFGFSSKEILYLDGDFVVWRLGRQINRPAEIELFGYQEIRSMLQSDLPNFSGVLDENKFGEYVRQQLAQRIRGIEGLPLAAITHDTTYRHQVRVVLVSPDVFARSKGVSPASLTAKAAPKALPAPAKIGPVAMPVAAEDAK